MGVKEDIIDLKNKQESLFTIHKRYVQALPTPETLPKVGSVNDITILRKPDDETVDIAFIPTAKDYQFEVSVWRRLHDGKTTQGYQIIARRDLGDGIVEIVRENKDTE